MAASSAEAPAAKAKRVKKLQASVPFTVPKALARRGNPAPPYDSEATAQRVPVHEVRAGKVPQSLREAATASGLIHRPELPDEFAHAVHRQGRPLADKMMRKTTRTLINKGVRFGSGGFDQGAVEEVQEEQALKLRPYTDTELRSAFTVFDLNGNDYIDAAELTHIFAQMGEMPSENEISAMILLCDPRGEGQVNFDDFLNIFANPAESLRNVNVKAIKHLLPRRKIDFDIRDPLGLVLEEKWKLKEVSLMVVEVRKGSQSHDAGVRNGWKILFLEDEVVKSERDFEKRIQKLEKSADPDEDEDDKKPKGRGKGKKEEAPDPNAEAKPKKQMKYDYSITFAVLAGADDSSSEEEEEDEDDDDILEDEEEDDA